MNNIELSGEFKKGKIRKVKTNYKFCFFDTTYSLRRVLLILVFSILSYEISNLFGGAIVELLNLSKGFSYLIYIGSFVVIFYSTYEFFKELLKIKYSRISFGIVGEKDYTKKIDLNLDHEKYIKLYSEHVIYKVNYYGLKEVKKIGKIINIKYTRDGKKGFINFKPGDENMTGVLRLINKNWDKSKEKEVNLQN